MYEWTLIGMGFAAGFSIAGVVGIAGILCCNRSTAAYLRVKRENHWLYETILAAREAGEVL